MDVDWYVEDDQPKYRFKVEQEKASLHGVGTDQIAQTLRLAIDGMPAGLIHQPREKEDFDILLRLPLAGRSSLEGLKSLRVMGNQGNSIALGELVTMEETTGGQKHLSQESDAGGVCDG